MQMSSISIFAGGSAVIAPLAVFLRYLLKQPFKVASTSQELLDLFEDRRALLEEHATLTSPNDEGRVSERFTVAAASNELVPVNASSTELSTSTEAYLVYRIQPARGLHKKHNGRARSLGTQASAEEETSAVSLRTLHGRRRKEFIIQ
jgi:hypothetical protein